MQYHFEDEIDFACSSFRCNCTHTYDNVPGIIGERTRRAHCLNTRAGCSTRDGLTISHTHTHTDILVFGIDCSVEKSTRLRTIFEDNRNDIWKLYDAFKLRCVRANTVCIRERRECRENVQTLFVRSLVTRFFRFLEWAFRQTVHDHEYASIYYYVIHPKVYARVIKIKKIISTCI